ncbi:MAG: type II toxin-antitoxin system Phd/YefM family antitoxin [Desulfobacterales bacterium]|nr:type II toxin-antitoxin system Phd/YefM family antitoxin [Desulfobacterales bacterium]
MNTIPAQEIKRRGITAVDELIETGDVHIIKNNQPRYVVLSEARYRELIEAQNEAYTARVRASLEDLREGRVSRFASAKELLNAIESEDEA